MLLRKLSATCLVLIACILLVSCGSGGGYGGGSSATLTLDGVYYGTLNPGSSMSANNNFAGAVGPGGHAYFFSSGVSTSNVLVYSSISGTGQVTSNMTDIPSSNVGGSPTSSSWQVSIVENSSSNNYGGYGGYGPMSPPFAITGTGMIGAAAENFSISYQTFSDTSSTIASLAGSYQGSDITRVTAATLTVSSAGALTGTDGLGCALSGTLTQDPDKDVFVVSMNITGSGACPGAMSGEAFVTNNDISGVFSGAAGTYLYIVSANAGLTAASTLELKLQ